MAERRRGRVQDQRADDLAGMGVDAADAGHWLAQMSGAAGASDDADDLAHAAQPFQVWPGNWPVVQLFLQLQTQWRHTESGHLESLRLTAAEAVMRARRLPNRGPLMEQLIEMEHAAIAADQEMDDER